MKIWPWWVPWGLAIIYQSWTIATTGTYNEWTDFANAITLTIAVIATITIYALKSAKGSAGRQPSEE